MRKVTSTDVAARAGVSQATVARCFASPELVSPPTRLAVQQAASFLGYSPNAIARSLRQQRTNIIAALVPANGEYWQQVVAAFSMQLAANGKQLLLFSLPESGEVDPVLSAVDQFRVDGLIMASSRVTSDQLVRARQQGIPMVAFNQPAASGLVPSVTVDNEGGMRMLAAHVVAQRCRTVRFIGGVRSASTDKLRYTGAAQELGRHGVACPYSEAGAFTYDSGYKTGQLLAQDGQLPDAVMVASDELAFGVADGLEATGIRVGIDIVVTGFDGLPQASWARYDLTTLVQPTDLLVQQSIAMLLGRSATEEPIADRSLNDRAAAGAFDGTSLAGTALTGTALDGTALDGTSVVGTTSDGTSLAGTSVVGTLNGRVSDLVTPGTLRIGRSSNSHTNSPSSNTSSNQSSSLSTSSEFDDSASLLRSSKKARKHG